ETAEGYNWRMTELQAAIAIPQLHTLKQDANKRDENARQYFRSFSGIEGLTLPEGFSPKETSWHQFTMLHKERDYIVSRLRHKHIDARIYYPELVSPEHLWDSTPVAKQKVKEIFSIPVH